MGIRRAHMATYPAREQVIEAALRSIEPQVDEIHLVLNEYREVPAALASFSKLNPIIPDEDYKDVGKFVTQPADDDQVFFVDDDLCYSPAYFDRIVRQAETMDMNRTVFGLHASIYRSTEGATSKCRKIMHYRKPLRRSLYVDQVATNSAFALGKNVPSLAIMSGSQKFVDVRYAKWCFEQGIDQVALARPFNMARPLRHGGETIYRGFTVVSPDHVLEEIRSFAGKSKKVGQAVGPKLGLFELMRAA